MAQHHATRRSDMLRQDRERQKARRDELKWLGAPTTHVLNRAIVEGFMYCLDAQRAQGDPISTATVSAQDVLVYATRVLTKGTNATDRYEADQVKAAINKRLRGSFSKFRIAPTWTTRIDDDDQ